MQAKSEDGKSGMTKRSSGGSVMERDTSNNRKGRIRRTSRAVEQVKISGHAPIGRQKANTKAKKLNELVCPSWHGGYYSVQATVFSVHRLQKAFFRLRNSTVVFM